MSPNCQKWPIRDVSTYEEVLRTAARATPRRESYVSSLPPVRSYLAVVKLGEKP